MSTTGQPPVSVCHWNGKADRFFGKYKDAAESDPKKRWKKIPGGPFAPDVDTKAKAIACARRWYVVEMADRQLGTNEPANNSKTWAEVCDAFRDDVKKRLRGADGSKHEALTKARMLRRHPVLGARAVMEHDENIALVWLRAVATEPITKKAGVVGPRDAHTTRNSAKVLRDVYRFARRSGWFPHDRVLPPDGEDFKDELSFLVKNKKPTQHMCPVASVVAVVQCAEVNELRRVTTQVYAQTGMRPGELHGLLVSDVRKEDGIAYFDITKQFTLDRGAEFPAKSSSTKTRSSPRPLPVHPELLPAITDWIENGWRRHVGRDPQQQDFLFPDTDGKPFREERGADFRADLVKAGCSTLYVERNGTAHELGIRSLRHTFATLAKKAKLPSDVRDKLMGHAPKDTKAGNYEVTEVPFLFEYVKTIPPLLTEVHAAVGEPIKPTAAVPEMRPVVTLMVPMPAAPTGGASASAMITAEEKRFELLVDLHPRRFSKPLP